MCPGSTRHEVKYARTQRRTAADNYRQTAANFENQAGDVFRVTSGRLSVSETCYLTADSALITTIMPLVETASVPCDSTWAPLASRAKGRTVERCWALASAPPDIRFFAVQFATMDTSALASIVVLDGPHVRFQDYPATYAGPDEGIWRVDDGGVFLAYGLRILFAARIRGVMVLAITWPGTEGDNAYLLAADSRGSFRTVAHSYRYWGPE